jgi:hypothetical protein
VQKTISEMKALRVRSIGSSQSVSDRWVDRIGCTQVNPRPPSRRQEGVKQLQRLRLYALDWDIPL